MVKVYTDGSCYPNPGSGGWAFVVVKGDKEVHSGSGYSNFTTNNRMELTGVWEGLKWLRENDYEEHDVLIISDSQYVVKGLNKWVWKWIRDKESWRKNAMMWDFILKEIKFFNWDAKWVRGHNGDKWNEKADELCSWERKNGKDK